MKKMVLLLMTIAMVLTMIPVSVVAEEPDENEVAPCATGVIYKCTVVGCPGYFNLICAGTYSHITNESVNCTFSSHEDCVTTCVYFNNYYNYCTTCYAPFNMQDSSIPRTHKHYRRHTYYVGDTTMTQDLNICNYCY